MRAGLTFGLAAVVLGVTLTLVAARARQPEMPAARAEALRMTVAEAPPASRAEAPVRLAEVPPTLVYGMPIYNAGPRIIHVPQPGERPARASLPERDDVYLDDDDDEYVPPPRRPRVAPKPQKRSDTPKAEPRRKPFNPSPPPKPRRTVLSAPPPAPDYSLTPIKPTPRFEARQEKGEKFATSPPPGYAPPSNIPAPETEPPPEAPAADTPTDATPVGTTPVE